MTVQVAGNTTVLNPSAGILANVANVVTRTNTFNFTNASSTVYAYVGVFNNYAAAAAMDHPTVGNDAGGVIIVPNGSIVVAGNFAQTATQANVYVAAITATGTTQVFATPVNPGSV
jgi:hypothetical protein